MANPNQNVHISGLAKQLINHGLLSEEDASKLSAAAIKENIPFVTYISTHHDINSLDIAIIASTEFGLPMLDINAVELDPEVIKLVDEKLITKHHALPIFKRGNRLFVAIPDPTNLLALDEIKFQVGSNAEAILVEADKLSALIEKGIGDNNADAMSEFSDDEMNELNFDEEGEGENKDEANNINTDADDTPIVRFINKILLQAIHSGTSDIHFEPYEKSYRVRFRRDGILEEIATPPVNMATRLSARLKVMSRLDISERRVPQDGRIKMRISKTKSIDFRVNTCPTLFGEKIVLRILDSDSAKLGIDILGYEDDQKAHYMKALNSPYGMILVTGPTGSGKTVSLYTGLNILNTPDRNISTAEDPVEINLAGINQVNVIPKQGMTFAAALKAFLRQDPDVVMVGEIRDIETAEIAVKAAQTGHLVLSTLHTNDAPQTLTRLANIGIPLFNIASSVSLIIAQRLGRRLCSNCKEEIQIPESILLEEGFTQAHIDEGFTLYGPVGCENCNNGYKGRVGIYQVLPITEDMKQIIMAGGTSLDMAKQAQKEGISNLRQSGLKKVRDGITSLEEINRVTKD